MTTLRKSLYLGTALAAMTAASCMRPGQYRVYRVANADPQETSGCFPGGNPGPDITGDSSTFYTGQTFGLYAADRETFFMDLEMLTLEGTKDGSDYSFQGESVDVMDLGDDTTQTLTSRFEVNAEIKGKKISGTSILDVTSSCTGMACPPDANGQCITTLSFIGAEVKDAELERPL